MRVNIYAEEMTDRVEMVYKTIDGVLYTGVRFYLYPPVNGDDDSAAVTFWGKKDLKDVLRKALDLLEKHHKQ